MLRNLFIYLGLSLEPNNIIYNIEEEIGAPKPTKGNLFTVL
jgi:hypothetical protein